MFNKFKFLILIVAILLSSFPEPASALFGIGDVGLFDVFDNMMGGIEEKTGPVFQALMQVFCFYAEGLGLLALSSGLLDIFISKQGEWMASLEPMTQAGWNFTAGLANMLLVLIFLIIAFAFIFKIENFQAKKALPKLLIVALLLNFSWVFVKMLVDVSQIVYNTLLPDNLFNMVMDTFMGGAKAAISSIITFVVALGISWFIPIANSFAQFLFSTLFTVMLLPNIIIWTIQGAFFMMMGFMFIFYAAIFAFRVFIIQILAILSPLAFLSLILPQTKSFWGQWYKMLTEWLLSGIFFLFFLVLGFGAVRLLAPQGAAAIQVPVWTAFNFGSWIIYYFAVLVYMAVTLYVGKKFVPSGAQELINFATGVGSTVVSRGLAPMGTAFKKNARDFAISQREREDKMAAGEDISGVRGGKAWSMAAGRWARKAVGAGFGIAGTTPEASMEKDIKQKAAEYEKRYGSDYKGAADHFRGVYDGASQAALMMYLEKTKGGKALNKLGARDLSLGLAAVAKYRPSNMTDMLRHMPDLVDEEAFLKKFGNDEKGVNRQRARSVQGALVSDGIRKDPETGKYLDSDVQKEAGIGTEEKDLIKNAAMKKVVDSMKTLDLENIDVKLGENQAFIETVAKWKNDRGFLQRGFERLPGFGEKVQEAAQGKFDQTCATNPSLILMQNSQFGKAFMNKYKNSNGDDFTEDSLKKHVQTTRKTVADNAPKTPELMYVSPQASMKDKTRFAEYAEGNRVPPTGTNDSSIRDLRGAINAMTYRIADLNSGIDKLDKERSTPDISDIRKMAIDMELENKNRRKEIYETRDQEFRRLEEITKGGRPDQTRNNIRRGQR